MNAQSIIVYHDKCADGTAAGWYMKHLLLTSGVAEKDIRVSASQYGDRARNTALHLAQHCLEYPELCDIYIVDFSFQGSELEKIAEHAKSVHVLDHHDSAISEINWWFEDKELPDNLHLHLDETRSGVGLVSKFFSGDLMPDICKYVEDYDLWRFAFPESRAAVAWLYSNILTIDTFGELVTKFASDSKKYLEIGQMLIDDRDTKIDSILSPGPTNHLEINGKQIPVYNVPYFLVSAFGERIYSETKEAVVMFSVLGNEIVFSLRSHKDFPVNEFAEKHGGGGHPSACGFRLPLDDKYAHYAMGLINIYGDGG